MDDADDDGCGAGLILPPEPEPASEVAQQMRRLQPRVSDPRSEASDISEDAFAKLLFFSITEKCIGRLLHPTMVKQSADWGYQDLVINALRAEYNAECREILTQSQVGGDQAPTRVLTQEYLQRYVHTIRLWTPGDRTHFRIQPLSDVADEHVSHALQSLLDRQAFEGRLDGEVHTLALPAQDERLVALHELAKLGIVKCCSSAADSGEVTSWQLTEAGLYELKPTHSLVKCSKPFEPRRDIEPSQMTLWELVLRLEATGWSRKVWHDHKSSPAALVLSDLGHRPGAKTFYIRAGAKTLRRCYLLALLEASDLKKKGVEAIEHFRRDRYYTKILHGRQHGITRAIGMDPELGGLTGCTTEAQAKAASKHTRSV